MAHSDNLEEKGGRSRLRMSPLSGGYGMATPMVAATGVADNKLFGFRGKRVGAVMHPLAEAACSGGADTAASATGSRFPTSAKSKVNLAVRRCMGLLKLTNWRRPKARTSVPLVGQKSKGAGAR